MPIPVSGESRSVPRGRGPSRFRSRDGSVTGSDPGLTPGFERAKAGRRYAVRPKFGSSRVDDGAVSYDGPEQDDRFRDDLIERALSLPLGDQVALARVADLCDQATASPQGVAIEAS